MKNSYKLYGTFWDNRSFFDREIIVYGEKDTSLYNTIEISRILSNENPTEYFFTDENPIILLLDYFPSTKSVVIIEFYVKRILQIADYYNVNTIVCKNQDENDIVNRISSELIKRKTPNKLLAQSNGALQMIC